MAHPSARAFALCSSEITAADGDEARLGHEARGLLTEARAVFDEALALDPRRAVYHYPRAGGAPRVMLDGRDVSGLSCLVVRGTTGLLNAVSVLVQALLLSGCQLMDPPGRFAGAPSSKLLPTVEGRATGAGIPTWLAFSRDQALDLVRGLEEQGRFPLLAKPVAGKQGQGVTPLATPDQAREAVLAHFHQAPARDTPLLVQERIPFAAEYRVVVVDGRALGCVEKRGAPGPAANAATGACFVRVDEPAVQQFAERNVHAGAVLGVDVGRDRAGELYLVEANFAPLWKSFEAATGVNVAREIVAAAMRRLA